MKKILALVLCLAAFFGCEDDKKEEHKDCDCAVAGQMDAGQDGGMVDMGPEGGAGGEENAGMDAGMDAGMEVEDAGAEGGMSAGDMAGSQDAGSDCMCEGDDCAC